MAKKSTEKNKIELYFEWWLMEMVHAGYIKFWKREPETLIVRTTEEYGRYKRFKSKEKVVEAFNLFPEISYTYDYVIGWEEKAEYIFYEEILAVKIFQFGKPTFLSHRMIYDGQPEIIAYIDVKPTNSVMQRGGKVSSAISFPLKQRMLWEEHKIFINKVVPMPMAGTGYSSALFCTTFTPQRYLLTDVDNTARKIKWPITNLKGYVELRTNAINKILETTK